MQDTNPPPVAVNRWKRPHHIAAGEAWGTPGLQRDDHISKAGTGSLAWLCCRNASTHAGDTGVRVPGICVSHKTPTQAAGAGAPDAVQERKRNCHIQLKLK